MKLYVYDRHRRIKLLLCVLMILVAFGVHFWTRTRHNTIDYQTESWEAHMPPYVPTVCIDEFAWPEATPVHLQRWVDAKWVDWKLVQKTQLARPSVTTYFRHWIALSSVWTTSTPFVCVSRTRIEPLGEPWIAFLSRLPERVEVVFWANAEHPGFASRPTLGKARLPNGMVALRSAPSEFTGLYMVRTRALRKKLFRLFPIAHSFEHTLCQVFRAFRAPPLGIPVSVARPILQTPRRWKAVAYPVLDILQYYDARSLRYWIRSPLSDAQLVEYMGHLQAWMQHHHEADWLLVHAETYTASEMLNALDTRLAQIPVEADAVVLVSDRDQLPLEPVEPVEPVEPGFRRLGYVERPQLVLYRTQSIRDKIHRLFPILHNLGVALCTQWQTYGSFV